MFSPRLWLATISVTLLYSSAFADFRVLPHGEQPRDVRLQPLKDLDGYFPFTPPTTREDWAKRAEAVKRQISMALGLWPEPTRTPLNPVIHGRIDRDDYTVEKVYFESMPGFFVTGSLYRPKNSSGRHPGVLCPHGHWPDGRFMEAGDNEVRKELTSGAEKFENAARSPLQARCVQLARMGCVVFHYDMLGYADSVQIPMEIAHKFAKQRPEMIGTSEWGLFSPQAETYAQSIMGLQTWNSIRALDFLQSLPDVDRERIGVTGASGGGTQTMILASLDSRVKAAFPAVMVSTAMQGGCTCENASLLRVGTGNIEFAALFAPKPMAMTAANDWTKEMETKGFPELKRLWALLGAPDNVALTPLVQFPHNYNAPSRGAMYTWFNKHLGLNLPADRIVKERDFQRLSRGELSVWDTEHPAPAGGPEFERKLLQSWRVDIDRKLQEMAPQGFRKAVETVIGRSSDQIGKVTFETRTKGETGGYAFSAGLLRNETHNEELPAILLSAKTPGGAAVVWLNEEGKSGLFAAEGQLRPEVQALLEHGIDVLGVDLLFEGEFVTNEPLTKTRKVKNPREAAAYTFGYNHSLFAQRTHDVLSALRFLAARNSNRVGILALDSSAPIAAAARAIAPDTLRAAAISPGDFRFLSVRDIQNPNFQPAASRFGDVPGLLACGASGALRLSGTSSKWESVSAAYRNAGSPAALSLSEQSDPLSAVEWLKEQLTRTVTP